MPAYFKCSGVAFISTSLCFVALCYTTYLVCRHTNSASPAIFPLPTLLLLFHVDQAEQYRPNPDTPPADMVAAAVPEHTAPEVQAAKGQPGASLVRRSCVLRAPLCGGAARAVQQRQRFYGLPRGLLGRRRRGPVFRGLMSCARRLHVALDPAPRAGSRRGGCRWSPAMWPRCTRAVGSRCQRT